MTHITKRPLGRSVDLFVPMGFPRDKRGPLIASVYAKLDGKVKVSCAQHEAVEDEELKFQIVAMLVNFPQSDAPAACRAVSEVAASVAGKAFGVVCTDPSGEIRHECERMAA